MATVKIDSFDSNPITVPLNPFGSYEFPGQVFGGSGLNPSEIISGVRIVYPHLCTVVIGSGILRYSANRWSRLVLHYASGGFDGVTWVPTPLNFVSISVNFVTCPAIVRGIIGIDSVGSKSAAIFSHNAASTLTVAAGSFSGLATASAVDRFSIAFLEDPNTSGDYDISGITIETA